MFKNSIACRVVCSSKLFLCSLFFSISLKLTIASFESDIKKSAARIAVSNLPAALIRGATLKIKSPISILPSFFKVVNRILRGLIGEKLISFNPK